MLAAVCLFTYDRLKETKETVDALKFNLLASESELFIFSDGSKNNSESIKIKTLRNYLKTITGFKSVKIIESSENKGLANSIIYGVSHILEKYEKVIILEDDLVTSPNFLNFMNDALDFYQQDKKIQSISGFSLSLKDKTKDVYFQTRPGSWGWATWKDRWNPEIFNKEAIKSIVTDNPEILNQFKQKCGNDISKMLTDNFLNKNDSWYVRWAFDHFRKNNYTVFPAYSYVQNIGFAREGTHCKGINTYRSELVQENKRSTDFINFQVPDQQVTRQFLYYFTKQHKIITRLKLLKSKTGRTQVLEEIKLRIGL
ncbi:MAG: glycosyltransferase [Prolixibacteraceae bacterium]|nr:glycosyltransferase [Prolixibacteraceae bacterium]